MLGARPRLGVVHSDDAEVELPTHRRVAQRPQRRRDAQLDRGFGMRGDQITDRGDRRRPYLVLADPLAVGRFPRDESVGVELVAIDSRGSHAPEPTGLDGVQPSGSRREP